MKNKMTITLTFLILLTLISVEAFPEDEFYRQFVGHGGYVYSVAFSPDGQTIASGSSDESIRLWNANTGASMKTLGHPGGVFDVAFSPDGQTIASLNTNSSYIYLWNAKTGEILKKFGKGSHYSVAFSPDGQTIASGIGNKDIGLWDIESGSLLKTLVGHARPVNSIAFSPDGQTLASGSNDATIRLWNTDTGAPLKTLVGHGGYVYSVAYSPDGARLASGSRDGTVRLWDIETGSLLTTLVRHRDFVYSVAFSPDGKTLASGSDDSTIRLWNAATGAPLNTLYGHAGTVNSVAFSPDGARLASASSDGTVRLWNTETGAPLNTLYGPWAVDSVAFSPDGATLANGSSDGTVRLWNADTGAPLKVFAGHADDVNSVVFHPDGATLASGSADHTIGLWDIETGSLLKTLLGHEEAVYSVAFSPDGAILASGSKDRTIRVWDIETGSLLKTLVGHAGHVNSVAFSPDGATLASGSADHTIRLWNTDTGAPLKTLVGHADDVNSVVFHPAGATLASGSDDKTIRLWDYKHKGTVTQTLKVRNFVESVAFSSNKEMPILASAGWSEELHLWDPNTGEILKTLVGHKSAGGWASTVNSVAFRPDGETLASASANERRILLWDVTAYDPRLTAGVNATIPGEALEIPQGLITDVAFTPNHTYFVLHPQLVSPDGAATGFIRQKSTITLRLRKSNYQMFSLEAPASVADQWEDIVRKEGETLVLDMVGKFPFVSEALRIKNLFFSIRDISDPDTDPQATVSYFPNSEPYGNTVKGDLSSILFVVPNERLTSVGFNIKQDYYAVGDWVPINLEYNADTGDVIDAVPGLNIIGNLIEGAANIFFQTIYGFIEAINNNALVRATPQVLTFEGVWDLETTFEKQKYGLNAPSASVVSLADYPPFEKLTPEAQQYLLQHFGETAPLETLTPERLQIPQETSLLANYPNPFNPETWIPYQLSEPAEVTLTIYAADGQLIRTLALGHQRAGLYESRSRAAYWDGRNAVGETVASGLYFYTLTAGDFTATRKMLILK